MNEKIIQAAAEIVAEAIRVTESTDIDVWAEWAGHVKSVTVRARRKGSDESLDTFRQLHGYVGARTVYLDLDENYVLSELADLRARINSLRGAS